MNSALWGLGLRPSHFSDFHSLESIPALEIMADNLIHHRGGPALYHTQKISSRAPFVVMHGIGLNIGGADPLKENYLRGLRELVELFQPTVVSDHLCFTQAGGLQSYELLPVVRNQASLAWIAQRVDEVQQFLGRQFCLENVSAYIEYQDDSIPEGDFLNQIAERTGCGILLDVNNVYVSAKNFFLDPLVELERYNLDFVRQIHIAGHSVRDDFLFDSHDTEVCQSVWMMLKSALKNGLNVPIILENDNADVSLQALFEEMHFGQKQVLQ